MERCLTGKPAPWFYYSMTNTNTAIDTDALKKATAVEADLLAGLFRSLIADAERGLAILDNGQVNEALSGQHARDIAERVTRIRLLAGVIGQADAEEAIRKGAERNRRIAEGGSL